MPSRFLTLLALGAASAACGDVAGTVGPHSGALSVAISGLAAGVPASVAVDGPAAFSRALTASATLTALAPGTYTVTAQPVSAGAELRAPSPASQAARVRAGETTAVRVSYDALQLDLAPVASGLASPVYLAAPPGDARLFVVEQGGRIRVVKNGGLLATPFLDISSRVLSGGERGLLSVAFDPHYATNGFFYVYYTNASGDVTIERYAAGSPASDVASAATATPVITIPHPSYGNHNGGLLLFGPDGMLYAGTGDGGGGGDPSRNAQNLGVLLGKLLRLDVRTLPYTIPPSNPFAGQAGRRGEIWAYGLRNPWRYAFDSVPGAPASTLYIADVGQSAWEEVDVAPASVGGINYGWNATEGSHCYPPGTSCSTSGFRLPATEYDHSQGCSITGGFVYRGAAIPELAGHYFYSDYCSGWLASMTGDATHGFTTRRWSVPNVGNVTSFGEDGARELYVVTGGGTVYRIVRR